MTSPCKCGGNGYIVDWKADKIVRCRECDDCIDKKGYGEVSSEEPEQLDLFAQSIPERSEERSEEGE